MRTYTGYAFLAIGIGVLLYFISLLETFIADPDTFNLYRLLAALPEAERTLAAGEIALIIPVGVFKALGMFLSILFLFVAVSIIKTFFSIGVQLIAPKIEDVMEKVLARLKAEALSKIVQAKGGINKDY